MWRAIAAAASLAMAFGCAERRSSQPLEPVTIELAMLPHFSLVHVAEARGYFREEGLAVTLRPHQFGKVALASLTAGQGDLATSAETPLVFAELSGHRLSILASIGLSRKNMAVVALTRAGISGPGDLKGKRIGVTRASSGEFFLDTFLLRHGLERREVRFLDLRPEEMEGALASGRVDAVATWNPTALLLQRRFGDQALSFYEDELYSETLLLIGRRGFAEQRPEAARRVLRALLKAEGYFQDHPEEARRVAAAAFTADPVVLDAMLRQLVFRVRLDQGLLVLMEEEARWAIRAGLVATQVAPSYLETIAADPLASVRPDAVGFIR